MGRRSVFGGREQRENRVAVGQRVAFDRPPDQQWDMGVVGVFVGADQLGDDRQSLLATEALGRAGQLAADDAARIGLR